jgi:fimbrial chaperone protein
MAFMLRSVRCGLVLAALIPGVAHASGLQVEPVSVTIEGRSNIVWLSNTAETPVLAQIRVYRWTQHAEGDELAPTDALLASPPMANLAAGGRQLVRLVAVNPVSCEDTFRLAIDEVPTLSPKESGLRYVLHYSVPVFVNRRGCDHIRPEMAWSLARADNGVTLTAANHGAMHAQLAQLRYVTAKGARVALATGLLGYVLPGKERKFTLPIPATTAAQMASGGTLELAVNGSDVTQPLALAPLGR